MSQITIPQMPWAPSQGFVSAARKVSAEREAHISPPDVTRLIDVVAEATGFTADQILSHTRGGAVEKARHLVMFEAHAAGVSKAAIGRAMNRDHSTVLHGIRKEQARRAGR